MGIKTFFQKFFSPTFSQQEVKGNPVQGESKIEELPEEAFAIVSHTHMPVGTIAGDFEKYLYCEATQEMKEELEEMIKNIKERPQDAEQYIDSVTLYLREWVKQGQRPQCFPEDWWQKLCASTEISISDPQNLLRQEAVCLVQFLQNQAEAMRLRKVA